MAENGRKRKGHSALLLALAGGKTVREAAREAGVGERTVHRRLRDSEFRVQLNEARAEMIARGGNAGRICQRRRGRTSSIVANCAE